MTCDVSPVAMSNLSTEKKPSRARAEWGEKQNTGFVKSRQIGQNI